MKINTIQHYTEEFENSVKHPESFWSSMAESFVWKKKWDSVLEYNWETPKFEWFKGGKLNITENCLDRHLKDKGKKNAIIWEPNNPKDPNRIFTYNQLFEEVCTFSNVLKNNGVKKGDRVCIYMPMVPELAFAVLACARIGAIHSVVFAGFSAKALASRINDAGCKMLLTCDGANRGTKQLDLKTIVNEALLDCPTIERSIVLKHTKIDTENIEGRDVWWADELEKVNANCAPEIMDSEDTLFVLYTSGSTGKPKGMVHTCGGYMVYTAYSFQNVFQYEQDNVFFCTADIGWITGHSYIVYGPLLSGATTLMFEGVPSYPDFGRFWNIVEKYKVNQFYTAPTAIRSLACQPLEFVKKYDLSSLKVLGTVGEPINEEAWHWYDDTIGENKVPIVDTWWQTETGGIMISPLAGITKTIPTFATLPLPGIQPCLMDENGNEIMSKSGKGSLCIKHPWPSMARTIYGDHKRYKETYFSAYKNAYFTGDGAYRDESGNYRVTGRMDDVIIVSGHNLGTAPIENSINEHELIAECAVVGMPHDIKGNALFGYLVVDNDLINPDDLFIQVNELIRHSIGPIAKLDRVQIVSGLPKTRSGKIMRRILRKIALNELSNLGDISTLLNPEIVKEIIDKKGVK